MSFKPTRPYNKTKIPIYYYAAVFLDTMIVNLDKFEKGMVTLPLEERLKPINTFPLFIFVIDNSLEVGKVENNLGQNYNEIIIKRKGSNEGVCIIHISTKEFFTSEYMEKLCQKLDVDAHSEFILICKGISMSFLKTMFRSISISLSSGNNTIKGITSPGHYLLSTVFNYTFGLNIGRDIINHSLNVLTKNRLFTRSIFDYHHIHDEFLRDFYLKNVTNKTTRLQNGELARLKTEKVEKESINDAEESSYEKDRDNVNKAHFNRVYREKQAIIRHNR